MGGYTVLQYHREEQKKFVSLWKGSYTVLDKPGIANYKIQLIGEI